MKKIVSFAILATCCVMFMTSCNKDYQCKCNIKYVTVSDGKVVYTTTSSNTINAKIQEDASKQCKYFEEEIDYLNQKTTVQHYCGIE